MILQSPSGSDSDKKWYVVHCRTGYESLATKLLGDITDIGIFWPRIKYSRNKKSYLQSFFPGYIFILADLNCIAQSAINTTPGVIRLVTFQTAPQPIETDIVLRIRRYLNDYNQREDIPVHAFQSGDHVRIRRGPFQGVEALFLENCKPSERVRILIEILGQQRVTEIDAGLLEAISSSPVPTQLDHKRERRSRGRGRSLRATS